MPQNFGQRFARLFGVSSSPPGQLSTRNGALVTQGGVLTTLDITAATVIFTGRGHVARVSVLVAGTGTGTINDAATTGAAGITNALYSVGFAAAGVFSVDMPVTNGLVVVPGAGQTLAISYYH